MVKRTISIIIAAVLIAALIIGVTVWITSAATKKSSLEVLSSRNVEDYVGETGFKVKNGITFDKKASIEVAEFTYENDDEEMVTVLIRKNLAGTEFNILDGEDVEELKSFNGKKYELVDITDYTAFNMLFIAPSLED